MLDLSLETLDNIDAPLSDMEWGIIAGVVVGGGLLGGAIWAGIIIT